MSRYAQGTSVPVERSRTEAERILARLRLVEKVAEATMDVRRAVESYRAVRTKP